MAEAGPSLPQPQQTPHPHPIPTPPCLLAACEAGGTGLQCTEAFGQSVPLLDVATALLGAAPQGASLQGNWQGEGAGSLRCLQRQRAHISAFSTTAPSTPCLTLLAETWGRRPLSGTLPHLDSLTCLRPKHIKADAQREGMVLASSIHRQCQGKSDMWGGTCQPSVFIYQAMLDHKLFFMR